MAALIKRKGSKYWYVVWWQGGRQRWRSTRMTNRRLAEKVRLEVEATCQGQRREEAVRAILEEVAKVEVPLTGTPVDATWELYERAPKPRRMTPATLRTKGIHVRHWLKWMEARHPEVEFIQALTDRLCYEYFQEQAEDGLAGQTRNNRLSCLHDVFEVIRVPAGLERNVWDAVPRVEAGSYRHEALTVSQVEDLYVKAQEFEGKVATFWPAAVALGWHTGLRLGDVCTLEWSEIHEDEDLIRLVPRKGWKRNVEQAYVLHPDFMTWVHKAAETWPPRKGDGHVWPPVARAYLKDPDHGPTWLFDEFRELCRRAEIEVERKVPGRKRPVRVVSFHSFRHTFVTEMLERGEDVSTAQAAVGHGSPVMTTHYSHSLAASRRASEVLPGLGRNTSGENRGAGRQGGAALPAQG